MCCSCRALSAADLCTLAESSSWCLWRQSSAWLSVAQTTELWLTLCGESKQASCCCVPLACCCRSVHHCGPLCITLRVRCTGDVVLCEGNAGEAARVIFVEPGPQSLKLADCSRSRHSSLKCVLICPATLIPASHFRWQAKALPEGHVHRSVCQRGVPYVQATQSRQHLGRGRDAGLPSVATGLLEAAAKAYLAAQSLQVGQQGGRHAVFLQLGNHY